MGAETLVWQGARTVHTPRMERTSNAASQMEWIDAQTGEVIFARTLRFAVIGMEGSVTK